MPVFVPIPALVSAVQLLAHNPLQLMCPHPEQKINPGALGVYFRGVYVWFFFVLLLTSFGPTAVQLITRFAIWKIYSF